MIGIAIAIAIGPCFGGRMDCFIELESKKIIWTRLLPKA